MAVTTWQIDPAHSTVQFSVKHMMFTTVRGRFKTFSGTIEADAENPDRSKVTVEIDAATIDTGVADRDGHLRSGDFLDVDKHPKIAFRTTRVDGAHANPGDRFKVEGTLEIRGQSLPVTLDATFEGLGKDPWGNERAGFTARTEIDRREWGLQWNQALESGGILVGNSVRIDIEAQAIRQQAGRTAVA
ncbi:MAG TPA: YceI family protein [Vicinamibacterales bacterium]|jgi:polyisoprenoid-binding protein YceI